MSPIKRILGIVLVFIAATVAWMVLGAVMTVRTSTQQSGLQGDVAELWGSPQKQAAPTVTFHWDTWEEEEQIEKVGEAVKTVRKRVQVHHADPMSPIATQINVGLALDERLKGLMWYSLYDVAFSGAWSYKHERDVPGSIEIVFPFPDRQGLYDDFRLSVKGSDRARDALPTDGKVTTWLAVQPGQEVQVEAGYKSRGMDQWSYEPGSGVSRLESFSLVMTTDFEEIDFPSYTMSPSSKERVGDGWRLAWQFARVITGHQIGMVMPSRIQPGEMAAKLSFSAPISLLFFFLILFVISTLRQIDVHPVNYLFLAGAFFAFHLLFGYSVDHIHLVPAFILASLTSIVLLTTYLRLVVSRRFALREAALAQLVYLVGFSLAYFWEGFTGLTVTVLSIVTLFVLMQLTGRLNWSEVLKRKSAKNGCATQA